MSHELPALPYALDALEPYISQETLEYHYGKHHLTYVNNLNNLIKGTEFEHQDLETIIKQATGSIYNNAAQVWNHTFYWNSLAPQAGGAPTGEIATAIERQFGTFEKFKEAFTQSATTLFGSGWTWLVKEGQQHLAIINTSNAEAPLRGNQIPLLTCDVWEHAYYIDVRNARAQYLKNYWQLVNWHFVNKNFIIS